MHEELELEKSISEQLENQVKKRRTQIEELLATIDKKDKLISSLQAENDELKNAVNSIHAYLREEKQKLVITVREKIENCQNET